MKKIIKQIASLLIEALEKENELATVTVDHFKEIRRDINNGDLDSDSAGGWSYEIGLVTEVIDRKKFAKDAEYLDKMVELLDKMEEN